MSVGAAPTLPRAIGAYLALLQFLFALGWVVYTAYLPQLAQQVGLERRWVPWILALDQLIFIVCDLLVGVWSDRAARVLQRVSRSVLLATVVSVLAFVLLPAAASTGSVYLFLGLTLIWAITSSALRAPPLTLLGRYVPRPSQPAFIAMMALGLGLCNALAPYLALQMKGLDPRWPFLLSGLVLALVTLGMGQAERALARVRGASASPVTTLFQPAALLGNSAARIFLVACLLAAAAFQAHVFLLSAPLYLRQVASTELAHWLPIFWIGFNLALWPASRCAKAWGAAHTLAAGCGLGALALAGAQLAPSAATLGLAQGLAGVSWALTLCAAFGAALAFGHTGQEGIFNGALQSLLASAAFARLLVVAMLAPAAPQLLAWGVLAVLAFAASALVLWWGIKRATGWPTST